MPASVRIKGDPHGSGDPGEKQNRYPGAC